jgi:hypothetical protein
MRLQALLCGAAEVRGPAKLTRAQSQRLRRVPRCVKTGWVHSRESCRRAYPYVRRLTKVLRSGCCGRARPLAKERNRKMQRSASLNFERARVRRCQRNTRWICEMPRATRG